MNNHPTVPTVLLVEDDPELRERYASSLRQAGATVITVDDGPGIEEVVSQKAIDIIVSDTNLPTLDGDLACRRLKEQGRLGGVFVLAMSDDRDCEIFWKGIAHDFLYKGGITNLRTAVLTRYRDFRSR